MIANGEKDRVTEQKRPARQDGLAQNDKDDAHILWVSRIFVEASHHQPTRGSYGAGVPRPRRTKSMKHQTIIDTPGISSIKPIKCAAPRLKRGPQLVAINANGTSPSTVPGTRSVNKAVRNQSM